MQKNKLVFALVGFAFVGLVFLLFKENERAVAAEAKFKEIQYKIDSLSNEKENAITDLEAQVDSLKAKSKEADDRIDALLAEKNTLEKDFQARLGEAAVKYDAMLKEKTGQISDVESRFTEESKRFQSLLKEKNAEIESLASQLKETSARVADLLKKKEALESENLACENRAASLEKDVKRLERHNEQLFKAAKTKQQQTPRD